MAKLEFLARGLNDPIIRAGLRAAAELEGTPISRGLYFLVGGIASQGYIPEICRRDTCDIDFVVLKPIGSAEFREFVKPAAEYLADNGYLVSLKKGHQAHQIDFTSPDGARAIMEFARKSPNNFARISQRLYREMENTRKKIIPGHNASIAVASPEDIALPKFTRLIHSLERNDEFCEYVTGSSPEPFDRDYKRQLDVIKELREQAGMALGDVKLAERLRFVADMYDIRALSEYSGFSRSYLEEGALDWDTILKQSGAKTMLGNFLFPNLELSFINRDPGIFSS